MQTSLHLAFAALLTTASLLAVPAGAQTAVTLTQSASIDITSQIGCRENLPTERASYFRVFDLAAEGLTRPFKPTGMAFGVRNAQAGDGSGTQTVLLRIHTLTDRDAPLSRDNLTTIVTGVAGVDDVGSVGAVYGYGLGELPAISPNAMLVVEVAVPDGVDDANFFSIGTNSAGETATAYYEGCAPNTPITPLDTTFPGRHWVMNLTGTEQTGPPPNDSHLSYQFVENGQTIIGSNFDATLVGGETSPSCQSATDSSVWYAITVPAVGTVTLDLSTSNFDTVLSLHPFILVAVPPTDTEYGCDDDGGDILTSRIEQVMPEGLYLVRVASYSGAGTDQGLIELAYTFAPTVASEATPDGTVSLTAAPNPTATQSRITLSVPTAQAMTVEVFDVTGRRVATLHDGEVAAGALDLALDASALPSGVYVVRAVGETVALSERITVVR